MTIEVGQILDKYELLEEVGQGGMAVVYRGMDHSLRREVAVKVLHRHLADHKEARDRFAREAHAVAKLRHENILEIFDFSGSSSSESYIVTEFIEGQTLKQFVSDHDIKYPEVGALITVQICRALSHAHGLGILHRDVKPENIMIRVDGVVKLTDFGIAQMVDLQRMTVTGQLLGSPAYMSPEHVEGQPLDFRTDVFSVGILLYQLVCGKLPFAGRNPHEILKRIAECKYTPPRHLNPMVGKELGEIIAKAMARVPADRFADISEMLRALEIYLTGSGLTDGREELGRFFCAPASYELALRARLLDALSRRGRDLLETDRVTALELFNRVLTIDPENEAVLGEINRISRQRRGRRMVLLFGGIVAVGALAYGAMRLFGGGAADQPAVTPTAVADASPPIAAPPDAAVTVVMAAPIDAATPPAPPDAAPDARARIKHPIVRHPKRKPDAGITVIKRATRKFRLAVSPAVGSEYRVGNGTWTRISGIRAAIEADASASTIEVRNRACCQSQKRRIADLEGGVIKINLGFLPGRIVPTCALSGVKVSINKKPATVGKPVSIPITSVLGKRSVEVEFYTDDARKYAKKRVKVKYKETKTVPCGF